MTNGDLPSLGETLRRLEEISRRMESIAAQMAQDRRDIASTYVRYDVYDTRHTALGRRIDTIETTLDVKEKESRDFRRQFLFLILSSTIPAVLALLLAINNLLADGGVTP